MVTLDISPPSMTSTECTAMHYGEYYYYYYTIQKHIEKIQMSRAYPRIMHAPCVCEHHCYKNPIAWIIEVCVFHEYCVLCQSQNGKFVHVHVASKEPFCRAALTHGIFAWQLCQSVHSKAVHRSSGCWRLFVVLRQQSPTKNERNTGLDVKIHKWVTAVDDGVVVVDDCRHTTKMGK